MHRAQSFLVAPQFSLKSLQLLLQAMDFLLGRLFSKLWVQWLLLDNCSLRFLCLLGLLRLSFHSILLDLHCFHFSRHLASRKLHSRLQIFHMFFSLIEHSSQLFFLLAICLVMHRLDLIKVLLVSN